MSDRPATATSEPAHDYDVVIVGGGPTGASAALFTARYGLDTVVFDRGNSSLGRCAYLENYLGFPAGIDVGTFSALCHEQVEQAGAEVVSDLVESVSPREDETGFDVEPQDGRSLTARRVVAATRYDGEYLRGLDADETLFETHEHDDEEHEHFRRDYADEEGLTPIEGLYVASPSEAADRQAIVAAGRGARVALALIRDVRAAEGFPADLADLYDWVRKDAELNDEWRDRDRWRDFFDERTPDDIDLTEDRVVALREAEIDRRMESYVDAEEVDRRRVAGHERLAIHLDEDVVLDALDDETILDAAQSIEGEPTTGEVSD